MATTTPVTTGNVSSPGLGSGLDVTGLVSKLMAVEQQPLVLLQQHEASYQAKITAFGALKGNFSSLQSAAQTLAATTTFTGFAATASDSTVLSASAGTSATSGTYNIGVEQLAKNQTLNTLGNYGTLDTFKGGSLAISVGSTNTTVNIADGSSVASVAQGINSANAGVTATIVNAGPPNNYSRLVIASNTTGSAGAITIAVTETGTGGSSTSPGVVQSLTDLNFSGTATSSVAIAQPADNAVLSINNVSITRSSNTITDAISGVTLSLTKAGSIGAPVTTQVSVAKNTASTQSAITAFVSAYNAAATQLRTQSAYNAATNTSSALTGDLSVMNLEGQLASLAQNAVTGLTGGISRISDIGITLQKDGTLAVNSTKFQAALANSSNEIQGLFAATTAGNQGVAVRFTTALTSILGSTGTFASETDSFNRSIADLTKQQTDLQARLTTIQARYQAQFTALDTLISGMNSTSSFLTQQLSYLSNLSTQISKGG
jgi:flagellar hook-associated protein 2